MISRLKCDSIPGDGPHLHQAAVQGARAPPQGLLGVHQRVFGVERCGVMWLHVLAAVRGGAGETGADGGLFHTCADVAPHHVPARGGRRWQEGVCAPGVRHRRHGAVPERRYRCVMRLFVLVRDLSEDLVDAELRTSFELALAQRTRGHRAGRPVPADTRLRRRTRE